MTLSLHCGALQNHQLAGVKKKQANKQTNKQTRVKWAVNIPARKKNKKQNRAFHFRGIFFQKQNKLFHTSMFRPQMESGLAAKSIGT